MWDVNLGVVGLAQERAGRQRCRQPRLKQPDQIRQGMSGINDVLDDDHMPTPDVVPHVEDQADRTRIFTLPIAIRRH